MTSSIADSFHALRLIIAEISRVFHKGNDKKKARQGRAMDF
jgi:hypothetical protein